MKGEKNYDNYGFVTSKTALKLESFLKDPQEEKKQVEKWQKILPKIPSLKEENDRALVEEVRQGIPDAMRAKVWQRLITPPLEKYHNLTYVEEIKIINLDIDRTIPTNKNQKEIGQKMKRVLNAIAHALPQMGYLQGINFIAATLLLLLDEQSTFNVMYHIFYWQRHQQLISDLTKIHVKAYVLQKLIQKHYPKLSKTLKKWEIEPLIFATSWFITLYSNVLPCSFLLRIIEIYLIQGEKILYRVALQILKQKKKIIKKMESMQEVMQELKNVEQFNQNTINRFFTEMFQINLSRKQLQNYQSQYKNSHYQDTQ